MSVSGAAPHVELCCKKVGDGHPLRLWRATTDVEAPPQEVLQRLVKTINLFIAKIQMCEYVNNIDYNYNVNVLGRFTINIAEVSVLGQKPVIHASALA